MRPSRGALLRAALGVAALVYLARDGAIQWPVFLRMANRWGLSLLAMALLVVVAGLVSWRFWLILRARRFGISPADAFRLTLVGNFFSMVMPGIAGGDVVRIYYAARCWQDRRTEAATVVVLDRVVGFFTLMAGVAVVGLVFPELAAKTAIVRALTWMAAAIAVAGVALFLGGEMLHHAGRSRLRRFLAGIPLGKHANLSLETAHTIAAAGCLWQAVAISLLAHAVTVGVFLALVPAIGREAIRSEMILLIPLGFVANSLPLTPAGLGIGELAMEGLFTAAGMRGGAETVLAWRMLTTLVDLAGFLIFVRGVGGFGPAARAPSEVFPGDTAFSR